MQKKLIALAIAGLSSTAFAQSTVTITGLFDTGVQMFKQENAGVTMKSNVVGSGSNSATTNLTFLVQEDLGSGMKAGLWLETDPTAGTANTAGVWNSQNYLYLSGGFGKISLGYMNNYALTSALTAQPFGVGMGGGYSGAFGRLQGTSVIGAPSNVAIPTNANAGAYAGARDIRANNSIKYETPNFSGFSGGFVYRAANSDTGNNNGTASLQGNADGQGQVGLNYNSGPANVSYTHSVIDTNVGGINTGTTTHNLLGANFTFATVTVYGGWTSSKVKGTAAAADLVDARSWNLALKWQATPSIAVMANVLKTDDKLVANQDRNLNALGLDYAMSKRTNAYVRWEGGDNDKSAGTGSNSGKFNRTALGLKHTF